MISGLESQATLQDLSSKLLRNGLDGAAGVDRAHSSSVQHNIVVSGKLNLLFLDGKLSKRHGVTAVVVHVHGGQPSLVPGFIISYLVDIVDDPQGGRVCGVDGLLGVEGVHGPRDLARA